MKKRVGPELKILDNMISRKLFLLHEKENINITIMHSRILAYLFKNKSHKIYQRDLEKYFDLRRSTMSGILQTMEKNGLILRIDDTFDARLKEVVVTSFSENKFKKIEKQMLLFDKMLTEGITKEELENFFYVIDKMKKNILK